MCVCFFFVGTSTWSAAAFTRKTSPEGETGKFPICGSGRGDYSSRAAPSDYLSSSSLIILRLNQRSHNHFFLRLEGRRVSPLHPELGGWNWINRQSRKQFESLTNLFPPLSLLLLSTTPDTSVVVDVFGWCCVCSHLENDGQHQQQHVANQLNSSPFWCPKLSRSIPRTTYPHNSLAKGLNWSYRPKSLCERVWVDNTRAPFPNSLSLSAESINKPREEATAAAIFQQLSTRVLHGRLIYLMTDWRRREREKENYGVEEKRGSRSRYTSKRSN